VEEGALYHALHRMEQKEWILGEWGVSEKGRRARYYTITGDGRAQLRQEERKWTRYMAAWQQIVQAAGGTA
jgi:DNA-binding PadR family transcriptional regulator